MSRLIAALALALLGASAEPDAAIIAKARALAKSQDVAGATSLLESVVGDG